MKGNPKIAELGNFHTWYVAKKKRVKLVVNANVAGRWSSKFVVNLNVERVTPQSPSYGNFHTWYVAKKKRVKLVVNANVADRWSS